MLLGLHGCQRYVLIVSGICADLSGGGVKAVRWPVLLRVAACSVCAFL